ncbi:MAG: hypothetical protein V4709_15030 [Pseudomonadota bacterium]
MRARFALTTLSLALLLCTAQASEPEWPAEYSAALDQIASAPRNDRALYQMQAGVIALDLGLNGEAARLFDAVLGSITAVYGNSESAARARSYWQEEGGKDFKGEPYERAMAFYYRGLLDLMDGEYDNARASFSGGQLQDAFAEDAQNQSDFASLSYLEGWCGKLMGSADLAEQSFADFARLRPGMPLPKAEDNLLVLVETGLGPRKRADNVEGNALRYFRHPRSPEKRAEIVVGSSRFPLMPVEDVYWQAATRGGRGIDRILNGKLEFRQTSATVGSALTGIASFAQEFAPIYEGNIGGAIAGVAAVGTAAQLLSFSTKTRADARYWNNLPEGLHVFTARLPAGAKALPIQFLDANGVVDPSLTQFAPIHIDRKGNAVAWLRSRRATSR